MIQEGRPSDDQGHAGDDLDLLPVGPREFGDEGALPWLWKLQSKLAAKSIHKINWIVINSDIV
jgi:hypothetical protein